MLERKLRGKKFIRSAESYDGPDVLRITSKLIDGKYYKYISSSGEEGKILDQELFLNYQAFKPDYVLGFRVFRSSDINGTKYLNCYLVYNPYLYLLLRKPRYIFTPSKFYLKFTIKCSSIFHDKKKTYAK